MHETTKKCLRLHDAVLKKKECFPCSLDQTERLQNGDAAANRVPRTSTSCIKTSIDNNTTIISQY